MASALGFNRVVYWGAKKGFAASHGDAGIVQWDAQATAAPRLTLRPDRFLVKEPTITSDSGSSPSAGPRNLQVLDENALLFSAGSKLFVTNLERANLLQTESNAEIAAIVRDDQRLIIVHEDGTISSFDPTSKAIASITRRGTRIRSAGALPWMGSTRLLLAGDDGPVICIGVDDQLVTEYQSQHHGIRVLAGSTDLIAGVSADRQRIILWQTWDGRQPLTEIYLTGVTRHRIADVAFG